MSKKMPPVHGALTEKTVYSLTLDTARFKVKNYAFCLHSLFKCFVWIPEHRLFLHTTLTDRFYTRGGMRLLRGTSCSCKYRVILSLEAPDYCLMRNTGKCKSLDESNISREGGGPCCSPSLPVCVYKSSSHYLNNVIFYRQQFGASSERITLYNSAYHLCSK